MSKNLDEEGIYSWHTFAKNISNDIDIEYTSFTNCTNRKDFNIMRKNIAKCSENHFRELLSKNIEKLNESNKLFLYKTLKESGTTPEFYLSHPNKQYRKNITKFRISDHKLLIETGRYYKIPREDRLCSVCKKIDDEIHFFIHCNINVEPRKILLNSFIDINIDNVKDIEILKVLLNPSTPEQIRAVAIFIQQSLELRKGDPSQS